MLSLGSPKGLKGLREAMEKLPERLSYEPRRPGGLFSQPRVCVLVYLATCAKIPYDEDNQGARRRIARHYDISDNDVLRLLRANCGGIREPYFSRDFSDRMRSVFVKEVLADILNDTAVPESAGDPAEDHSEKGEPLLRLV